LGAHMASIQLARTLKVELAVDNWNEALAVYQQNFSSIVTSISNFDLGKMVDKPGSLKLSKTGAKFAAAASGIDVVIAGPPCQGNSDLNNSSRRVDPRNLLYTVPVAFGIQAKAKIIVVENVPPVVHALNDVVDSAFSALKMNGYAVIDVLANAQDFGVAQTRKRHILIASQVHTEERLKYLVALLPKRTEEVQLWPFIEDLEFLEADAADLLNSHSKISPENVKRIDHLFRTGNYELPNEYRPPCHRDKAHSYISMYGRLRKNFPAQTITSGFGSMGQGRYVHPTQRRMITPHEAARIQGFPDYFQFESAKGVTALRQMIGNAVAPPVAAVLLKLLLETASS
jgi:DNA (cytosine-5)-methyltransferase 1